MTLAEFRNRHRKHGAYLEAQILEQGPTEALKKALDYMDVVDRMLRVCDAVSNVHFVDHNSPAARELADALRALRTGKL